MLVTQHLNFDVAWMFDVFFEVDRPILEGAFGFLTCRCQTGFQTDIVMRHAHTAATTACCCLDQHRIAHFMGQFQRVFLAGDQPFATWHDWHIGRHGQLAGLVFVAQLAHSLFGRADELDVTRAAYLGKMSVFREEAVTRVNGLHIPDFGGGDDSRNIEIAFRSHPWPDANGLICQ